MKVKEISTFQKLSCKPRGHQCQPKNLQGRLKVSKEVLEMDWIHKNELPFINEGGWHMPTGCYTASHTAILIPFRNREQHLPVLMRQLHSVLRRRQIHYRIFVIEQSEEHPFNRGKLFNVGFKEALSYFPYNCFVLHDVDLIPEDDRIFYDCRQSPAHMSVAVDTLGYRLMYETQFGGVCSVTKEHFELVNGFPNIFWKWGGEDDNISFRFRKKGLRIHRQPGQIARYTMLGHKPAEREPKPARTVYLWEANKYADIDGINSLKYRLLKRTDELLFTRIEVGLEK